MSEIPSFFPTVDTSPVLKETVALIDRAHVTNTKDIFLWHPNDDAIKAIESISQLTIEEKVSAVHYMNEQSKVLFNVGYLDAEHIFDSCFGNLENVSLVFDPDVNPDSINYLAGESISFALSNLRRFIIDNEPNYESLHSVYDSVNKMICTINNLDGSVSDIVKRHISTILSSDLWNNSSLLEIKNKFNEQLTLTNLKDELNTLEISGEKADDNSPSDVIKIQSDFESSKDWYWYRLNLSRRNFEEYSSLKNSLHETADSLVSLWKMVYESDLGLDAIINFLKEDSSMVDYVWITDIALSSLDSLKSGNRTAKMEVFINKLVSYYGIIDVFSAKDSELFMAFFEMSFSKYRAYEFLGEAYKYSNDSYREVCNYIEMVGLDINKLNSLEINDDVTCIPSYRMGLSAKASFDFPVNIFSKNIMYDDFNHKHWHENVHNWIRKREGNDKDITNVNVPTYNEIITAFITAIGEKMTISSLKEGGANTDDYTNGVIELMQMLEQIDAIEGDYHATRLVLTTLFGNNSEKDVYSLLRELNDKYLLLKDGLTFDQRMESFSDLDFRY